MPTSTTTTTPGFVVSTTPVHKIAFQDLFTFGTTISSFGCTYVMLLLLL